MKCVFVEAAGMLMMLLKTMMMMMTGGRTYEQPYCICTFSTPVHSYSLWSNVHGTAASLYVLRSFIHHIYIYKWNLYSVAYKMSKGAVKTRGERIEFVKDFKIYNVSGKLNTVRSGIPDSWTSVTEAPFTEFSSSATFDVVSGVGGPQTGSTTGFSDWLHRVSQVHIVIAVVIK